MSRSDKDRARRGASSPKLSRAIANVSRRDEPPVEVIDAAKETAIRSIYCPYCRNVEIHEVEYSHEEVLTYCSNCGSCYAL